MAENPGTRGEAANKSFSSSSSAKQMTADQESRQWVSNDLEDEEGEEDD